MTAFAPIINAEPNRSHPGATRVVVLCPHCDKRHHHGLPTGRSEKGPWLDTDDLIEIWGWRVPDCAAVRSYALVDPNGLVRPQGDDLAGVAT